MHPTLQCEVQNERKRDAAPLAAAAGPAATFLRAILRRAGKALVWWHLCSLDAPCVATVWTAWIAQLAGEQEAGARLAGVSSAPSMHRALPLAPAALLAMFAAVWILYAIDRLLDGRKSSAEAQAVLEARHHFHRTHRRSFCVALVCAVLLLAFSVRAFDAATLVLFAVLGTLVAGWFLLIHTGRKPRWLPKEVVVALVFSAATFLPTYAHAPGLRVALVLPAALFAAVLALNGLCIHRWEHPEDTSLRRVLGRLPAFARSAALLPVAIVITASAILLSRTVFAAPCFAALLSAVLLVLLDRFRPPDGRADRTVLRTAADLMLLTPVPFLLVNLWAAR